MNVILTGVTGTLGSQVLLELFKRKDIETIYLFVRNKKQLNASQRFQRILDTFSKNNNKIDIPNLRNKTIILDENNFFNPKKYLSTKSENYFIHSAGYVNLSTKENDRESILNENFNFSKHVFETFNSCIKKFTYISTAFSIGDIEGEINDDYHNNINPNFRNAYEESKYKTEQYLIEESNKSNIAVQILRPSVIGGNIEKSPKSYISKFMVYYLIGKFFYKNPLLENNEIRLSANFKGGLNIIPVDYVAKVIAKAFLDNSVDQLNIVNKQSTNFISGFTKIIQTVGFKGFSFLNNIPTNTIENKNTLEEFYYSSSGNHLAPYTLSKPHQYNTNRLEAILPMPIYNLEEYLEETITYAMKNNFRNENW